jgi:hypothetical protein
LATKPTFIDMLLGYVLLIAFIAGITSLSFYMTKAALGIYDLEDRVKTLELKDHNENFSKATISNSQDAD